MIRLNLEPLARPSTELAPVNGKQASLDGGAPTGGTQIDLRDVAATEQFLLGLRTHSGQVVTPDKAKRCSAVLACMRGISEDLSSLPIKVLKDGPDGEVENKDHPVYSLLNIAPNKVMTPLEVREHMIYDLMLWGGFYNLLNDDGAGSFDLWPLQAGYVSRQYRELVWNFTDPTTGATGRFSPDGVWRGSMLSGNGIDGQALTLLAREAIGLLMAADEQAARLFSHGVQTDLTLASENDIEPGQVDQLRAAFMQRHSGSGNAFMPLILQGGLKATRIGLTAQESQYMEARGYQVQDVARVFRYPSVLLGVEGGKSSTYASAEQFFNSYTKHTLLPWATRIEQSGRRDLFTAKEQPKFRLHHDFDQLLKADQAARYDNWNKAISGGWMQPAEARRKEGMPYKPGLDYFNRAKNMDSLGGASEPAPTDQSA